MDQVELVRAFFTGLSPRFFELTVTGEPVDPGVAVPVSYVQVTPG